MSKYIKVPTELCAIRQHPSKKSKCINSQIMFPEGTGLPCVQATLWPMCKCVPLCVCMWCDFPHWFTSLLSMTGEVWIHLFQRHDKSSLIPLQDKSSGFKPLGQNMLHTLNARERKGRVFCPSLSPQRRPSKVYGSYLKTYSLQTLFWVSLNSNLLIII